MRILVLGADGMLGHQLAATLGARHDVAGTVRSEPIAYQDVRSWLPDMLFDSVDVRRFSDVERCVAEFVPDAVINAVGIVKQRREAKEAVESIEVNSLLPHRLAGLCITHGINLVHLSTDCVFSGRHGMYQDDAPHDATDLYGRSKSLGEVSGDGVITLRTSIIGLELKRKSSLVEWFLSQEGEVTGFTRAIFSGFTTSEMAKIIEMLLLGGTTLSGIYNVSSDPIDKYSLLDGLNGRLGSRVDVRPDQSFECDRSLDSSRFRNEFGYRPPSWDHMLDELAAEIHARGMYEIRAS